MTHSPLRCLARLRARHLSRRRDQAPESREKQRLALNVLDELAGWQPVPPVVVADACYGQNADFRAGLTQRGIRYVVGIRGDITVQLHGVVLRGPAVPTVVTMAAGTLALTACGTQGGQKADAPSSPRSSVAAEAAPKPPKPPKPPKAAGDLSKAAQEAAAQRAAAAPSGDPVSPTNTAVPDPADYGFGKAAATAARGEVIAYTPRLESGREVVPLTIHNNGDKRMTYTVTLTVVGGTQKSPFSVTEKADGVWPGTTWPTKTDITASGLKEAAGGSKISLKVAKADPFADAH
ncbi:hypothetical protein GCM10010300_81000 [Streptomyces olivaceoviridis]|nr:transposase [Streptomyces olivaceoviridis]GGZ25339.1 hypothetical protein GCM10010300_81000 [Streptomyces olivaceoviridis]